MLGTYTHAVRPPHDEEDDAFVAFYGLDGAPLILSLSKFGSLALIPLFNLYTLDTWGSAMEFHHWLREKCESWINPICKSAVSDLIELGECSMTINQAARFTDAYMDLFEQLLPAVVQKISGHGPYDDLQLPYPGIHWAMTHLRLDMAFRTGDGGIQGFAIVTVTPDSKEEHGCNVSVFGASAHGWLTEKMAKNFNRAIIQ